MGRLKSYRHFCRLRKAASIRNSRVLPFILSHGTTEIVTSDFMRLSMMRLGMYGYRRSYSARWLIVVHDPMSGYRQLLFFIPIGCIKIAGNPGKVDNHDPGSLVHRTIVHAGVNFPIDVLSAPGLSSHQDNGDRRIPEIPVSDCPTNLLVRPCIRNIACVHGPVDKYGIAFAKPYQGILVILVVTVVVTDEYFVHCHGFR